MKQYKLLNKVKSVNNHFIKTQNYESTREKIKQKFTPKELKKALNILELEIKTLNNASIDLNMFIIKMDLQSEVYDQLYYIDKEGSL